MAGERILVIEDNPMNMLLATDVLQAAGYTVIQADNAEMGIQLAVQEAPDAILMDIALPGMDGLLASEILKEDPTTKDTPIVAVTARAMRGDDEKARKAGCDGYITKPINARTFPKEVAALIDSARRRGTQKEQ